MRDATARARQRIEQTGGEINEEVSALLTDIRDAVADGIKEGLQTERKDVNFAPAVFIGTVFGAILTAVMFTLAFVLARL